jgi:magnesium-transporting ATPase (P-type)
MSIGRTRFKGRVKIRGRPTEQAKAEIMIMKQKEAYEGRQRRRRLFTVLDIIIVLAFLLAIYFVYVGFYLKAGISLVIGVIPLIYFILRRVLKNRNFYRD